MPKSEKQRVEGPDDIPVRVLRRRDREGEEENRKVPQYRGGMLQQSKFRPPPHLTEDRTRLLIAAFYHLIRNTVSGDAKMLAFLGAISDVPPTKEDRVWLAQVFNRAGSSWPEGF